MTGTDLRRLRERRGLNRDELAALINEAIGPPAKGKPYDAETVARWERGREPAARVRAFLDELAIESLADDLSGAPAGLDPDDDAPLDAAPAGDSAPGGPAMPPAAPRLGGGSSTWTRACEELWELVATGVGMVGAATGNLALVRDGEIILADKGALGAAWGRLAETNETFRRMLTGMTEGGVWLQVAMVTGSTFSKCWQSHQAYAQHLARVAAAAAESENGSGGEYDLGAAA